MSQLKTVLRTCQIKHSLRAHVTHMSEFRKPARFVVSSQSRNTQAVTLQLLNQLHILILLSLEGSLAKNSTIFSRPKNFFFYIKNYFYVVREWCLFQLRDGSLFMKIYSLTELNENARVQGHYTFHVTAIFIWFLIKHCT